MDPEQQKQATAGTFHRVADGYDSPALRFFVFAGDRLADRLRPRPGWRVLDVACGTGAAALAIAQMIRPGGRVHAIDLAEGMLDRLAANARPLRLDNIDLHLMDGEAPEFRSDYFDAVVCSFALFFMPDMLKALGQWRRVAKPGGRLLFTSFTLDSFQPMTDLLFRDLAAFGVDPGVPYRQLPGYRLADPGRCRALLEEAGLEEIEVVSDQLGYHLAGADDWWEVVWNSGFRGMVEQLPPGRVEAFRTHHLANVHALKGENGIRLPVEVIFSSGRKPAAVN